MRVAVIRGDLPGPIFMADLEPTSQYEPPIEARGQTRYVSRPTPTSVGTALTTYAPATVAGTSSVTVPVTLTSGNNVLRVKTSSAASFTAVTIAAGTYATLALLVTALNTALAGTGVIALVSSANAAALALATTTTGAGAYLSYDSTGNGSTFNTPGGLGSSAVAFTVPTAATVITTLNPVGGPVNVSAATIQTNVGPGLTTAQIAGIANSIAPQFIETDVAIKSFQVGNLSKFVSASYNPDPNRLPALTVGPAVVILADDGSTTFASTLPTLSNAQTNTPATGQVTLTGTGIGNPEMFTGVTVKFTTATGAVISTVTQKTIEHAGGTIATTSIVIPASLTTGVVAGCKVQVKYTSLASNVFTLV